MVNLKRNPCSVTTLWMGILPSGYVRNMTGSYYSNLYCDKQKKFHSPNNNYLSA